jgi:hypothetical protein
MKRIVTVIAILLALVLALLFYGRAVRISQVSQVLGGKEIYRVIAKPDRVEVFETVGRFWKLTNGFPPLPKNFASPAGDGTKLPDSGARQLQRILLDRHSYRTEIGGPAPDTPEIILAFTRGEHRVELIAADDFRDVQTRIDGMLRGHFCLESEAGSIMRIAGMSMHKRIENAASPQ